MSYDYGFPLLKYLCWNDIILNVLSKKYKNTYVFMVTFIIIKKLLKKKDQDQLNMIK